MCAPKIGGAVHPLSTDRNATPLRKALRERRGGSGRYRTKLGYLTGEYISYHSCHLKVVRRLEYHSNKSHIDPCATRFTFSGTITTVVLNVTCVRLRPRRLCRTAHINVFAHGVRREPTVTSAPRRRHKEAGTPAVVRISLFCYFGRNHPNAWATPGSRTNVASLCGNSRRCTGANAYEAQK